MKRSHSIISSLLITLTLAHVMPETATAGRFFGKSSNKPKAAAPAKVAAPQKRGILQKLGLRKAPQPQSQNRAIPPLPPAVVYNPRPLANANQGQGNPQRGANSRQVPAGPLLKGFPGLGGNPVPRGNQAQRNPQQAAPARNTTGNRLFAKGARSAPQEAGQRRAVPAAPLIKGLPGLGRNSAPAGGQAQRNPQQAAPVRDTQGRRLFFNGNKRAPQAQQNPQQAAPVRDTQGRRLFLKGNNSAPQAQQNPQQPNPVRETTGRNLFLNKNNPNRPASTVLSRLFPDSRQ